MASKISMNSDENGVDIGTPFSSSYLENEKREKNFEYSTKSENEEFFKI